MVLTTRWFVSTMVIALAYGWILLGLLLKKLAPRSKAARWVRPFAQKRKDYMHRYVKRLLEAPHNPDVLALQRGEAAGTLDLADRMELEKRIHIMVKRPALRVAHASRLLTTHSG